MRKHFLSFLTCHLLLIACFTANAQNDAAQKRTCYPIQSISWLGEFDISNNRQFDSTTIGGLSGIDYDAATNTYYLISDDRSQINPARFYTANISISLKGIDSVKFTGVHFMLQPDGKPYPNSEQNPSKTPDPEAMRFDPVHQRLVWTSEGERIVRAKDTVLENPTIISIDKSGKYLDSFPIPANLKMHAWEKGPRQNGVLEGLAFDHQFKTMYVSVEEPLYEDGPRADTSATPAYIRILKYNTLTHLNTRQYAYRLDQVAYAPKPSTAFKINGVSDIMSLENDRLLVIERSYSSGRLSCTIKAYQVDLNDASDISRLSLAKHPSFVPVKKKLLLNFDSLGKFIDNIEGVCFGPRLANGKRSLIFVSDNNFNAFQKTQLLLFEVNE